MRRPDVIEMLGSLGYEPRGSSVGDFDNRLRADIRRYSRVVFDAGIARPTRSVVTVNAETGPVPGSSGVPLKLPATTTLLAR